MGYSAVDKILTLQEEELKFMENIRNCINMRIKCDRDYASSLLVVSVCAQKCHLSDDIGKTSIGKAWMSIASQMQELSKLVNASAEELTHEVLELMDELVSEKKALRKALIEEYNKYSNKLENLMKSVQKIQTEYQKCLMSYKCTKTKYEDIYLRLPKKTDNSTLNGKIQKRFDETKRRYKKLCQKLHLLHNDYCLITIEAKQYEKDLRLLLIPSLISFNDVLLMDSGEKWNNILIKYVEKTDLTQDKYRKLQNQLRNSVENIIKSNIYGDLRGKLAKPQLPQLTINFNDKLLEDFIGALKPNQLVIDTFTIDSLKVRESQLQKMLIESQKDIREKSRLIKNYEQEMQSLSSLSNDNSKAQIGITTRKRALDIIKKDLVYAESEHERTHRLWEEVDVCLNKIAGIQVPNGLELNLSEPEPEVDMRPTSSLSCGADTSESARSISTMSYTMSWGRSIMKKLKLQKSPKMTSSSVSTRSYPSSMSRCSSEKRQERDTNGLDLNDEEWFHGSLPRTESNRLLKKKGDFLVRQTVQNNERCIVVSVFWNGFRHFIVNTDSAGRYKFEGPSFTTISDLIDYYQYNKTAITQKSGALILNAIPRESWELNNDDIELKEKIGRGNFGDVYKGILKKTGTGTLKEMLVAIKTCKINLPDEQKRKFLAEGRILKQYNHPNIVQLIGICVHKQPVMIVMELVEGGALINYLRSNINRVKLDLLALMRMCIDAASGMEYLESKNCIHRDLAARNCLIGLDKTVKISDFGMSREANIQLEYTVSDGMKQIPIKWTAPEALNYGRYTSLCDVWSFGILMWEVFTLGSAPYSGMSNTKARELIDNGYRLPCPPKTPENVYQIMHKCWKYEPENRPHFKQIRQFLEDIYFEIKKLDIKAKSLQNSDIEIHL